MKKKLTKSAQKRQRILDAAAQVFSEKGYGHATLHDIALAAETQAGSLYYHFSSRDHIVREVMSLAMNQPADAVRERIESLEADATVKEKLRVGLIAYLELVLSGNRYVAAYNRIIDQVPEEIRQEYLKHPRAFGKYWQSLIEEGQKTGEICADMDARLLMLHLLGSATWTLQWYDPAGPASPREIAEHLARTFLDGAAARLKDSGDEPRKPELKVVRGKARQKV